MKEQPSPSTHLASDGHLLWDVPCQASWLKKLLSQLCKRKKRPNIESCVLGAVVECGDKRSPSQLEAREEISAERPTETTAEALYFLSIDP